MPMPSNLSAANDSNKLRITEAVCKGCQTSEAGRPADRGCYRKAASLPGHSPSTSRKPGSGDRNKKTAAGQLVLIRVWLLTWLTASLYRRFLSHR